MLTDLKKMLVSCVCIFAFLFVATHPALTASKPPATGETLPSFKLAVPENDQAKSYLGLSGSDQFTVPQIEAQVVIIEIFNMYWPFCQKEAFRVNELYRAIQSNKDLKNKIKLIGIGSGNSDFEVNFFRKKYEVPFPLFSDEDYSIHKTLGEVRTPYFIGVRIKSDGSSEVFYSKLGGFKDADKFLKSMVKSSGL